MSIKSLIIGRLVTVSNGQNSDNSFYQNSQTVETAVITTVWAACLGSILAVECDLFFRGGRSVLRQSHDRCGFLPIGHKVSWITSFHSFQEVATSEPTSANTLNLVRLLVGYQWSKPKVQSFPHPRCSLSQTVKTTSSAALQFSMSQEIESWMLSKWTNDASHTWGQELAQNRIMVQQKKRLL